jgi:hypothetical protein
MIRPVLALERLLFLESEGKVGYRHGPDGAELERMDYLDADSLQGLDLRAGRPDGGRFGLYSWRDCSRLYECGPGLPDREFLTLAHGRDILFL